ncbi:glycosyltransferase family 2 protein, partial [Candidatus Enterococcus willemsii]|uniref:glycosyltransferase family 2 protein n=1 Tax=Candidatus Enterococcus willemsii TaxID=1857215 RepID=UPI0013794982
MNKVSVVVPCYNCATTIEKCCISILNQEKIDIELICIDDGSTDNTWEVLCGLKALYPKLIIHKIFNSGVSNARNVGISLSTNEFVGFVDADDTIHKEMYFKMSTELIMENIDLVICNFSTSDTLPKLVGETEYINQNDVLNASLYNSDIQGFVWNRLYKKHIIIENDIKFNPNMKAVEDLDFNLNYLQYANSCTYIQEQLYN